MNFFSNLKQDALRFLDAYKTREPATYAAAEQAIGALMITDGLIGIRMPFGSKKRGGIFSAVGGIVIGVLFMFIPTFIGGISGLNSMTAVTSATVVTVGQPSYTTNRNGNSSSSCSLTAQFEVNGQQYSNTSSMSSSNNCSLTPGQNIQINYDPANPGSWAYDAHTVNLVLKVFFWAGLLVVISSIVTFFIRLLSIIFGWKLLRDGRKNAANLPPGTNLEAMIDEIKNNFVSTTFGFGNQQSVPTSITNG